MRKSILASCVALASACGSPANERAESASSAAQRPATPTAPAVPAAPAEITRCTLGAAHVVTVNRRRPDIVVGSGHVAIVHKSRRPVSIDDGQCDPGRIVHTSAWPLTDTFATTPVVAPCSGTEGENLYSDDAALYADAARDGGDVFVVRCHTLPAGMDDEGDASARVACDLEKLGADPQRRSIWADTTVALVEDFRAGFAILRSGPTQIFAVAIAGTEEGDGVYGLFVNGDRVVRSDRLGRPPTAMDLDDPRHFSMTATPTPDGGFIFEHGATATTRRVRTTIGPTLARVGFPAPVTITAAAPRAVDFTTERAERSAPLAIRLVKAGVPSPVTGLSTTIATFGSDFAMVRERVVLVWSEGTGTTTRIRIAIVDPSTSAIVGDIIEVSTAGREAGYATIDAYEGNAAIAWDEKDGDTWQVRTAALDCR